MIRAGIIGLGKMGISHCAILGAHPDVDLVAVCDASSFIGDIFKKHTRFEFFSDYKKMIDTMKLECLVIASPTKFHAEMVSYALKNNIHVFCEKPFALEPKDSDELAKLAAEKKLVNQVGYHNRFIGTFNELKKLLSHHVIGELYHFLGESYGPVVLKEKGSTWRSEKGQGGGCLYDYASHTIDLINYVLGKPVAVAGTQLKSIFSNDVEDAVYSSITLQNGLTGQLSVNWSDDTYRKMNTQITVWGKKGKIIADATEIKIYLREDNKQSGYLKGWTTKYITELTDEVNYYLRGEEYTAQIDEFIKCVADKRHHGRSTFQSAADTDNLIGLLLKGA
jgi:predicted dehydrogenase